MLLVAVHEQARLQQFLQHLVLVTSPLLIFTGSSLFTASIVFVLIGQHNSQVLLLVAPAEIVRFTRCKREQDHSRVIHYLHRCDGPLHVKVAPDLHSVVSEAPYLELVVLTHRHYRLLLLELVHMQDALLVHTEARIDQRQLLDSHEDN